MPSREEHKFVEEIIWLFFSILTDRFKVFVLEAWTFFNVYIIGSHRRVTMDENVCENNDERIYSDSDAIENIVEKSMVVAF
jgi:hypothetical protein